MVVDEELPVMIARIDERTRNLSENLEACNLAIQQVVKDHEDRIRDLEQWQNTRKGEIRAAGVVGGASGFAGGFIAGFITVITKIFGGS